MVFLGATLLVLGIGPPAKPTAADLVTLRDGVVVLGQVIEPTPRGTLLVLVRRSWAETTLPDKFRGWQAAEAVTLRRAAAQRRDRLSAWRRDRAGNAEPDDAILAWIDRELPRLSDPAGLPTSVLMSVKLPRSEVRSVVRRPKNAARMLRQGWLSGFANVESMSIADLKESLEGRGFAVGGTANVSVDRLLPIGSETDAQWLSRRAATEIAAETGLRFLQTQGIVVSEPVPGAPPSPEMASTLIGDLRRLIDDKPTDPLGERLREVGERGRVGAVVTRLDISADLSLVRASSTLWVRGRGDRWAPAGSRTAAIRPDSLAAGAGRDLADDPQVKTAFNLVESLGLGPVPDQVKQQSLYVGDAARNALGQVRTALVEDLNALALPVHESPDPDPAPKARP